MMDSADSGQLVPIGCPDCAGVLRRINRSDRYAEYVCLVGHGYALPELIEAKERQVEAALWSAVALLQNVEHLLAETWESGSSEKRSFLAQRVAQTRDHQWRIRQMIQQTSPANTGASA